jgi:hypothetical protein
MSDRNDDLFISFPKNPEVQTALADKNVGDTCKLELEIEIISRDSKGISATITPGSIVPEGYEQEDDEEDTGGNVTASANQPPGYLGPETPPVISAMRLKRKGTNG